MASVETYAPSPYEITQRPVVDAAVVRGTTAYDYEPFASITTAAHAAEWGAVGEVVGWSTGRTLEDGDVRDYSAVLKVRVRHAIAGSENFPDGHAYVEVRRGGEVLVDGKPFRHKGAPAAFRTVGQLQKAVPTGTRVIVLGLAAPSDATMENESSTGQIIDGGDRPPAGTTLLSPYPQGLLFETNHGNFASGIADGEDTWGWPSKGTDETERFAGLVEQVTAQR